MKVARAPFRCILTGVLLASVSACSGSTVEDPGPPQVEGDPIGVAGAHEHGVVRMGLAVEGLALSLDFEAPADALFGFEHEPRSDEEWAHVTAVLDRLRADAGSLVSFEDPTICQSSGVEISEAPMRSSAEDDDHEHEHAEGDEDAPHDDEPGHEHEEEEHAHEHDEDEQAHEDGEHDHDHEEEGGSAQHSEVRLTATWTCSESPEGQAAQLQVTPFAPNAGLVDLTVVTSRGQAAARVSADGAFRF